MTGIRYDIYEVFGQERHGEPHVHVGSLLAADPDMALILARENFLRRQEYVSLWVAPRNAIRRSPDDPAWYEPATDKTYRLGVGYRDTLRKWRRFGAGSGTDGESDAGAAAEPDVAGGVGR